MANLSFVDPAGIEATYATIRPHVRCTPVLEVPATEFGLGDFTLVFKLESLQHSGSFKARGATANLLLRRPGRDGVTAASGGNHGTAVAYAAQHHGAKATIFVPTICSPAKIARIRHYGAELVITGERYADALVACEDFAAQHDVLGIHAYDEVETLLGQGTIGLEIAQQAQPLDVVMVAVGGGGLIGGIASWFAGTHTRVVGVEPEEAPTLTAALRAGGPVDAAAGGIAADSLAPKRVGALMFPIAQQHVAEVVLVSDDDIRDAQRTLWERLRVVAEPGGAAAAAIFTSRYQPRAGERVGVIVCGANTDAVHFTG